MVKAGLTYSEAAWRVTISYHSDDGASSKANAYTCEDIYDFLATLTDGINASTIESGGSGYEVGDTFEVDGGIGNALGEVLEVNAGVVTDYKVTMGWGYTTGVKTTTATSGIGSGLEINVTELKDKQKAKAGSSYYFEHQIWIIDSDTHFDLKDNKLQVLQPTTGLSNYVLWISHAYFYADGGLIKGGQMVPQRHSFYVKNGNVDVKNTIVNNFNTFTWWDSNWDGVIIVNGGNSYVNRGGVSFNNVMCRGSGYGMIPQADFVSAKDVRLEDNHRGMLIGYGSTFTGRNFVFINNTYDIYLRNNSSTARDGTLIDSYIYIEKIYNHLFNANQSMDFKLKSTFNVIIDETPDNIKIYDKDDTLIFNDTTCVDEEITYFNWFWETDANNEIIEETAKADRLREPFKVIITKQGYETIQIDDVYTTTEDPENVGERVGRIEKTIIRASLKKSVQLMINTATGEGLVKMNPENIGKNREFIG